ncbi:SGNH/GDSL hydrolase family protein [Novosphingobium terrae]|uniref:SGNH/GDSL hydrolase family protein n=1 Tax=Novosphingobium terrae TaxID=2726189 RepID=UPI00389B0835
MNPALRAALASVLALSPFAAHAAPCAPQWVAGWASSQMVPTGDNALPAGSFGGATLRQIIRPSIGGTGLRIRLSNVNGTAPLRIDGATLARAVKAGSAAIDPASLIALRFDGQAGVTIPAGAEYLSDPVALPIRAFDDLAITLHYAQDPQGQTSHPGSRATSWLLAGDHLGDADLAGAKTFQHWFTLSGLEVSRCEAPRLIVALGDSITDGHGATDDANDRWTDDLARRLQADPATRGLAIVNQGIGGNRLLHDGLGPNALSRLDRDVLVQPGAGWVVVLEGINDIGTLTRDAPVDEAAHQALVAQMIGAYRQIIARAHGRGIKAIGATVLPFMGNAYYHPDARNETDRQAVNRWIREKGHFDAVVDFDSAMRDPARPDRLLPAYDSGDHLHPSPEGYRAMAKSIPLSVFSQN